MLHNYLIAPILMLWVFSSASAKDVHLFENGTQVANYRPKLLALESGDVLVFDDGNRYRFERLIDEGETTAVLKVNFLGEGGEKATALRVPKNSSLVLSSDENQYTYFINSTIEGIPVMQAAELTPRVLRFKKSQYVELELVNFKYKFADFAKPNPTISPSELKDMEYEFVSSFSPKIAAFQIIGDFKPGQIVWDGEHFVLLDYTFGDTRLFEGAIPPEKILAFNPLHELEPHLDLNHIQAIRFDRILRAGEQIIKFARLEMIKSGKNPLSGNAIRIVGSGFHGVLPIGACQLMHLSNANVR